MTAAAIKSNVVVSKAAKMKPLRMKRDCSFASIGRIALCLFLGALFLYNPFLRSLRDTGNPTVCHPASHRATVGSSEMEKFSKCDGVAAPVCKLELARAGIEQVIATSPPALRAVNYEAPVSPQSNLFASLWFRPPPAV